MLRVRRSLGRPNPEIPTTAPAEVQIYLGHGLHPRHRARARHDAAPMLRSNADTMLRRTTAVNTAINRPARGDVEVKACDRAAARGPQSSQSNKNSNSSLITTIDDPARHEAKPPRGRWHDRSQGLPTETRASPQSARGGTHNDSCREEGMCAPRMPDCITNYHDSIAFLPWLAWSI